MNDFRAAPPDHPHGPISPADQLARVVPLSSELLSAENSGQIPLLPSQIVAGLLASRGDQRITLGADGLNKYGCSPTPRSGLVGFGSCTCSTTSPRGFRAAVRMYERLVGGQMDATSAFEMVRNRLRHILRLPADVEVALAPSGTDAEMLATAIAVAADARPLVNIVVGPTEVGSGTHNAAACRFYDSVTPRGDQVAIGEPINQELVRRVSTKLVHLRDRDGTIRQPADLESELIQVVSNALESDARILLHVVAQSKTGLTAPSFAFARRLKEELDDDVTIVVDAAQGRLSRMLLNELLRFGYQVIWTGSKYVGGPAFAGALFLPRESLGGQDFRVPAEFNQFFTREQFPPPMQAQCDGFGDWDNTGAALRWAAAIGELDAFYRVPASIRTKVVRAFEKRVASVLGAFPCIAAQSSDVGQDPATIYSFCVEPGNDSRLTRDQLLSLHQELNFRGFHLGQPVKLCEGRWALRVALSMPLVVQLSADEEIGRSLHERLGWLEDQLRELGTLIESLTAN